ncbi:MAG TPA: TolC family protein, partial [Kofleriaceae bacterium]|nr:TolC family protein [Kofleriaceae bacterium]
DLAELSRQRVALESDRDVTIAQLNALLHRGPTAIIPTPRSELAPDAPPVPERRELEARALEQRPELDAVASRERGARSRVDLAERDYYPDLRIMGSYNRMWHDLAHQFMVGLAIDLPLTRGRRDAAVEAAEAGVARAHAERDLMIDDVLREVRIAARRVEEADASAALYRDRVVPAAENRVEAIRLGLDAGRTTFLEVIRAERELRAVRLTYHQVVADTYRRRVELDRAVGRRPGPSEDGGAK